MCLRIEKAGCPKWWCQSKDVVFIVEKAVKGEEVGHSYTPSLVCPCSSIDPVWSAFTKKIDGKNSMETWLEVQNCEIEIRFFSIEGTQRTLSNVNVCWEVLREVEPVWVMGRLEPSPIMMSSVPMYGVCRERLSRSEVTWWDAPLSISQDGVVDGWVARWACGCHGVPCCGELDVGEFCTGTRRNEGHRLAVWPWILQIWQWPRYGLGGLRDPVVVPAGERLGELYDGRQLVVVVPCGWEGRQLLLLVRYVGFAVAGKWCGSSGVLWRETSKLRSF